MNVTTRRHFLKTIGAGVAMAGASSLLTSCASYAKRDKSINRPNFIFYITDDISWNDLGCYGNDKIKTPNLDKLAAEGVVFDNAYLTISSCSPSRCSMITGRYPHNTGAPELHLKLPKSQFEYPQSLRKAGYYTVLSGKNHMGDIKRAFDMISHGKGPGFEEDWVEILQKRPKDRPFFCWFASYDAHRPWTINDKAPVYKNDQVNVPPYIYDGPKTRGDLAGYYHEVSRADYYAGQLLKELERQGVADNTYIIFCSDNGRPFPRDKTRLYDSGIKTPLFVWAPKHLKPARTDSLVSSIDFSATILELAGVDKNPAIQGVSFVPILNDPKKQIRDYVFAEHNWHVYQAHERMVRYRDWVYIRNAWPQLQSLCMESIDHFPAGEELWEAEAQGKLKDYQRDVFKKPRPAEELFNVSKDPNQYVNLVDSRECREILNHLRKVMDQWVDQTGDTIQTDPSNNSTVTYDEDNIPHMEFRRGELPGIRKPDNLFDWVLSVAEKNATQINHPGPIYEKDIVLK